MKARDKYAQDGVLAQGERMVRDGGFIRFAKYRFQSEDLKPWVGKWVFVMVDDYWFEGVNISDARDYCQNICYIPIPKPA